MTLRARNYDLSPKRYKSIFTLRGDPTISLLSMFSSIFCKGQSHLDKIISCLLSRLFVIGAGERSCSKVSSGISSWNFQKVEWLKIKYTAYYYSIWVFQFIAETLRLINNYYLFCLCHRENKDMLIKKIIAWSSCKIQSLAETSVL